MMRFILNAIWFLVLGWELAIALALLGLLLCITIIGIPFGRRCFELIPVVALPF